MSALTLTETTLILSVGFGQFFSVLETTSIECVLFLFTDIKPSFYLDIALQIPSMALDPSDTEKHDFTVTDGHGYMLEHSRDFIEACRLNLQFYLWKDALKFNIHPSIPITKDSAIADVATGTGIWLVEVARELPAANLDGFDIDITQAPHQQWLPSNVTLRHWNIFEDLPTDLIGKYDLVHVRLLVLVIERDPRSIIRKFLQMLKPGGYLQWDELDVVNLAVKKVDSSIQTPALDQLLKTSYSEGKYNWTLNIPTVMAEEGFKDTEMFSFGDDPGLIKAYNEHHMLVLHELAVGLTKIGKHEAGSTLQNVIGEAHQESKNGAALCIPRVVCIGRK